jgi:hypothetical protein
MGDDRISMQWLETTQERQPFGGDVGDPELGILSLA